MISRRLPRRLRALLLAILATGLPLASWMAWPLPADMASPPPVTSVVVQDRYGLPLRTTRAEDGSRGGWVSYADVDPDIIRAFLAAEDNRFFRHFGVDPAAVGRAAWTNLRSGRIVSGASTLSMQTARLLKPISRTWSGKLLQALWALRLEAHLEKSRILELYLNRVPLGQGAVGVRGAARLYFDAQASDVSPGQAALLAALAHAPSRDNPLVAPDRAEARRNAVLVRMAREGYLTADEVARAEQEPALRAPAESRFLAPHFTTRLLTAFDPAAGSGPMLTGSVRSTIDLALQQALEAEVRHTLDMLHDRGARDASLVVLDNHSGGVLAWVGSPDFWAEDDGQVDMVVSPRQPGSALKPFLYGMAFERGFTAASVLPDVPHTYSTSTGPYTPQNYDRRFHGPVRARQALASSFNVPAVELMERLGVSALLSTLREAGFASLSQSSDHYGLGLALGNGEVTLLELANAYRGLANGGVWQPVRFVLDDGGGAGWGHGDQEPGDPRRFLSPGATALVLDILSDPVARVPGFGSETPFDFPFPAAAKTGTSRHFTDNWAVATTAGFTVAIWVGNFNGQPMEGVSGVSGAGPLLYRAVLETARRYPAGFLPTPEQVGALPVPICLLSGMRATPECPSMIEWFLPGTEPMAFDDWQSGGRTVLPPEYAEWAQAAGREEEYRVASRSEAVSTVGPPPTGPSLSTVSIGESHPLREDEAEEGTFEVAEARPYTIISPRNGDRYSVPPGMESRYATIPLVAVGASLEEAASWYVDGERVESARWRLVPGTHRFKVVWGSGATAEATVVVDDPVRKPSRSSGGGLMNAGPGSSGGPRHSPRTRAPRPTPRSGL